MNLCCLEVIAGYFSDNFKVDRLCKKDRKGLLGALGCEKRTFLLRIRRKRRLVAVPGAS